MLRTHSWRTIENSAAYLAPPLRPGMRVLDVGSGPGTLSIDLARRVAPGTMIGIDADSGIVARANGLAADDSVATASFRVGSAHLLEFADDSFEVVHAHQVLQHVSDPVAVLRGMRRVAVPGGFVAARDVDHEGVLLAPRIPGPGGWARTYDAVARANGGEPVAGRHLKTWAVEAGFVDLECSGSVWCFASRTPRSSREAERRLRTSIGSLENANIRLQRSLCSDIFGI